MIVEEQKGGRLDMEEVKEEKKKAEMQEIDLVELALKIWKERRLIIKNCIIAGVVGVIVAFSIPKEYETKVMLAPEASGGKSGISGSLGSLAAMAGFNLGGFNSEDAISPELYPKIISSTPFLTELFSAKVETKDGKLSTTLFDYMDEHQRSAWWGYIVSAPFKALGWGMSLIKGKEPEGGGKNVDPYQLTVDQAAIAKSISDRIITSVDKKTGVISMSIRMQDPLISAAIADTVKNKLQEHITRYRTSKAKKDLLFAESLYKEAQGDYFKAQQVYANFTDGNMNIVLARYKAEAERLQNEMNLAYGVYNQVAQQLQISKAKLQEITPVYTVIQPATVSLKAVKPKKALVLVGFVLLGSIVSLGWILLKEIYINSWHKKKLFD